MNGRVLLEGQVPSAVPPRKRCHRPRFCRRPGQQIRDDRRQPAGQPRSSFCRNQPHRRQGTGINWTSPTRIGAASRDPLPRFRARLRTWSALVGPAFRYHFIANILGNGITPDVLITALEQKKLARRLAEPNLTTLSGQKASFLAGGEFPVPIAQDEVR